MNQGRDHTCTVSENSSNGDNKSALTNQEIVSKLVNTQTLMLNAKSEHGSNKNRNSHNDCRTPLKQRDSSIKQNDTARITEKVNEQSGRKHSQQKESSSSSNPSQVLSNTQQRFQEEIRHANQKVLTCLINQKEQSDKKLNYIQDLEEADRRQIIKENFQLDKNIQATMNHINKSSLSP